MRFVNDLMTGELVYQSGNVYMHIANLKLAARGSAAAALFEMKLSIYLLVHGVMFGARSPKIA